MSSRADSLVELVELMGEDAAQSLRKHFGGTGLYVPVTMPDDHPIVAAIGREAADRLQAWAARSTIAVPKGDAVNLRAQIADMRRDGMTAAQIAVACNLSQRHVYRLIGEGR